jgi:3-carboxy-cis,cis-muconate cycloisomerase
MNKAAGAAGPGIFDPVFGRRPAGVGAVADDGAWLRAMLAAEAALARALERAGLAPAGAGAAVTRAANAANFGPADLAELRQAAALTGNPVPGLARVLTRRVADPAARSAVHRGATSQDIMDTAAMLLARDAITATLTDLSAAADAVARLAREHRGTLMIGRTLLQQAVPVTFGVVAAGWLSGLDSAIEWLAFVRDTRLAVQFGGAAGTLASLGDGDGDSDSDADGDGDRAANGGARVRALFGEELGLAVPPLPWHTERLRVIDVGAAAARACAALSKIARDVTLLAQTEVGEVAEGAPDSGDPDSSSLGPAIASAAPRRGGSSAMPNKSNPVAAVAILGCAKQAPGLQSTLLACAEQEYQRAAGAWHAEWPPFGQLLQLAASAASWSHDLLANLRVDKARMAANLAEAGGLPLAERVTALLRDSLGGPRAHDLVATAAARSASSGVPFRDVLLATPEIEDQLTAAGISATEVERVLDPAGYLGSADEFIAAALRAHAVKSPA